MIGATHDFPESLPMIRNTPERYGIVAMGLHWLMAALMIGLFVMGLWMHELPRGDFKGAMYGLHKSFGVLVLFLGFARLAWRLANPRPRAVAGPAWQHRASTVAHVALYGLMIAIPIAGCLMSSTGGHPTSFFGLFTMPSPLGKNEPLHEVLEGVHSALAWAMIMLVAGHVGAAVWHHRVLRDTVLTRMLPAR
jgi:cytochrome b561